MKRLPARRFPLIVACSIAGAGCGPSAEAPLPGVPATTAAPAAPTGPAAAAKAMQDGVEAWSAGKHDEAIADFAKAYELHPTNLQTAAVYGATLQLYAFEAKDPKVRNERLLRSAQVMRTLAPSLAQIGPVQRQKVLESIFNEGCVYADEGKPARAFDSLKEAIDLGYRDAKQLETDVTLAPLRKLPEFADLSKRIDAREAEEFQKSFAGFTSFPFQFSLSDVDGKPHTLAELKGKVAVVDFWGTWCLPCREELPTLAALSRKYKDQGLAMVGVNYERVEPDRIKATITSFLKEHDVPYPCVVGDDSTREQVPGFGAFPTKLFIDRSGKVRYLIEGAVPVAKLEGVIKALLAEPAAKTP